MSDQASMGPQPNSCGNRGQSKRAAGLCGLQWGHSQTAVETCALVGSIGKGLGLQWGHSQTAVETKELFGSLPK